MVRHHLAVATLAAGLVGAFGVPVGIGQEHRALFAHDSAIVASALKAVQNIVDGDSDGGTSFAAALREATVTDADGTKHLYFHSLDLSLSSFKRCGQVDAAKYMPASLFEPNNFLSLAAYAEATVRLYKTPVLNTPVELGTCASVGYCSGGGAVQGIGWTPGGIMGPICGERCQCNFRGSCSPAGNFPGFPSCSRLPACRDEADDPKARRFCSLCSPSTACPGCLGGTVVIQLYYLPSGGSCTTPAPSPPSPVPVLNIVEVAVSVPELSTLVAAVKAADLVDILSSPGPFTVLAPTNAAFAKIQSVVDDLLKPINKALLAKLLTYHVIAGKVLSAAIANGQQVATVEGQKICFEKNARTGEIGVYPCGTTVAASNVIQTDVLASNGVVHVIDQVLVPPGFLELLKPKTVLQLAEADPDLSTFVTACKAGGLTNTLNANNIKLTVYAPNNKAFAKLPSATLASLLQPANMKALVKTLTYHVIAGTSDIKSLPNVPRGFNEPWFTVEGSPVTLVNACTARCREHINPTGNPTPNAYEATLVRGRPLSASTASNGVLQVIDTVLTPPANDLWFRGFTSSFGRIGNRCAEVNAGARMPASLFAPDNAVALEEYQAITIAAFDAIGYGNMAVGRCADIGYTVSTNGGQPSKGLSSSSNVWAPASLMGPICERQCQCKYPTCQTTRSNLGLPNCADQSDDPKAKTWCSLCGPKFNRGIAFHLFLKAQSA